ncbi:hypothetical protein CIL05_07645 [Virgibacillus profundi]|uniref:Uncharacterized protein n=1 Tax=Virgibacillus profundi TaxID=2024555 RepID=A0A2A2IGS3_9BACI|nr:hypothetical protein [Virgibacillus profundi]PAV30335.1 hypothetical protein CIL05_07645 [Virgibacillus profundi]PXY54507.1 hypothetical protein CIT14_07730 [Virgibacillus profundi]
MKIGDKVRNIHNNTEGYLVYSTFGASVSGFDTNEDDVTYHFQTLGQSIDNYAKDWERIYKFKYNMKGR